MDAPVHSLLAMPLRLHVPEMRLRRLLLLALLVLLELLALLGEQLRLQLLPMRELLHLHRERGQRRAVRIERFRSRAAQSTPAEARCAICSHCFSFRLLVCSC
tara:strand:- start:7 stop:315 length:309 start_codon:yes stop_codon:yes gene_type:complete